MAKLDILVIEDDALARKVLGKHLAGHNLDTANDTDAAKAKLAANRYDICFIDLMLGTGDDCAGLELIPLAAAKGIYAVVMSALDSEDTVAKAYELGCRDFYVKGNEEANVKAVLERYSRKDSDGTLTHIFTQVFITEDPGTRRDIGEALRHAASELPIMILGPSGTGKTTLARVLHDHSGRKGELVAINCAAYTEDLLEAELFGYRKGAFTGADAARKGKLLQADGGTLFLDEVGAMSQGMQTKLLKAIEEKAFYPVGSDKLEHSSFRIISATLEKPQKLIEEKRLRFDFFQRIHGLNINLKPLSERPCDIFPLLQALTHGRKRLSFPEDAKKFLLSYAWPGNVREVRRLADLLLTDSSGRITTEKIERGLGAAAKPEPGPAGFITREQYDYAMKHGLNRATEKFTSGIIKLGLQQNGGKKTKTMTDLKISTRLFYSALTGERQ
jgi:two-component system nitrogen regulation response regulator GlnG